MDKNHLVQILFGIIIVVLAVTLLVILDNQALRVERDMIAGGHDALQKEIATMEKIETELVRENNALLKDIQKRIIEFEIFESKKEKK